MKPLNLQAEDMRLSGDEERFLGELIQQRWQTDVERSNDHVWALLQAIREAFDGSGLGLAVEVDPLLLRALAQSHIFAMHIDAHERYVLYLEGAEQYTPLHEVLTRFMEFCGQMIRQSRTFRRPLGTYIGSFLVPAWFVEQVRATSAQAT